MASTQYRNRTPGRGEQPPEIIGALEWTGFQIDNYRTGIASVYAGNDIVLFGLALFPHGDNRREGRTRQRFSKTSRRLRWPVLGLKQQHLPAAPKHATLPQ